MGSFIFYNPTPPRKKFLGAIFLGYDVVFPGRMKFYFLEPYPPTEEIPWYDFPWLRRGIPWLDEVLFSRTLPPHARNSLVRFSLVTTSYSLAQRCFIFQTLPHHGRNSLVQFSLAMTSYSLAK